MPYKKNSHSHGPLWDTSIKKNYFATIKKKINLHGPL